MTSVELYIDRAMAHRAEAAQSGTFLIGGYAGWPNFGDYLQLKSTVDIHERLGTHYSLFILLDAGCKAVHERNNISFSVNGSDVFPVYYHYGEGAPAVDGSNSLIRLPRVPPSTLLHIYGGGFINNRWGRPVRLAVSALINRHTQDNIDGQLCLFMSGLQVSPSTEVNSWQSLFTRAEYVGARDQETVALVKSLLESGDGARIRYSGDDSLLALAASFKDGDQLGAAPSIAAHINLADYSSDDPDRRLERIAQALATAARHFGAGLTCNLLIAYPSDHVREQEAAGRLVAFYESLVVAGELPPLTFQVRNIFEEAVNGTFHFGASFLVTCSYHVALTGLLSHCPTLLLVENDYYRRKAAGLAEAFKTHRFATVQKGEDVGGTVSSLLEDRTNRPLVNGSYAMWMGQTEKALCLSRLCLDMERSTTRNQLELTASAFREVAANLGELRKRRILEERLAKEAKEAAPITISISTKGLARYMTSSYWSNRKRRWAKSIRKRINKWP